MENEKKNENGGLEFAVGAAVGLVCFPTCYRAVKQGLNVLLPGKVGKFAGFCISFALADYAAAKVCKEVATIGQGISKAVNAFNEATNSSEEDESEE